MSLLGKVLKGVGSYLVEQGKVQQELRLEEIKSKMLYDRELALAGVKAQYDAQNDARSHAARIDEIDRTAEQNRATNLLQGEVQARRDAQNDKRDLEKSVMLKQIDLSNNTALEGVKHKYKLSEDQAQAALQIQRDAAAAHTEIERIVFSKNGQLIAYKKDGTAFVRGRPGDFNPSGSSGASEGTDLSDYLNSGGAASGAVAGRSYPAAPAAKKPGQDFISRYNQATPQTAPRLFRNGQKIPLNEAYSMFMGQ